MGKLIVLEGIDGTGKSTQYELLQQYLTAQSIPFRALTYPDYADPSSTLVRMYLGGLGGQVEQEDLRRLGNADFGKFKVAEPRKIRLAFCGV